MQMAEKKIAIINTVDKKHIKTTLKDFLKDKLKRKGRGGDNS